MLTRISSRLSFALSPICRSTSPPGGRSLSTASSARLCRLCSSGHYCMMLSTSTTKICSVPSLKWTSSAFFIHAHTWRRPAIVQDSTSLRRVKTEIEIFLRFPFRASSNLSIIRLFFPFPHFYVSKEMGNTGTRRRRRKPLQMVSTTFAEKKNIIILPIGNREEKKKPKEQTIIYFTVSDGEKQRRWPVSNNEGRKERRSVAQSPEKYKQRNQTNGSRHSHTQIILKNWWANNNHSKKATSISAAEMPSKEVSTKHFPPAGMAFTSGACRAWDQEMRCRRYIQCSQQIRKAQEAHCPARSRALAKSRDKVT